MQTQVRSTGVCSCRTTSQRIKRIYVSAYSALEPFAFSFIAPMRPRKEFIVCFPASEPLPPQGLRKDEDIENFSALPPTGNSPVLISPLDLAPCSCDATEWILSAFAASSSCFFSCFHFKYSSFAA